MVFHAYDAFLDFERVVDYGGFSQLLDETGKAGFSFASQAVKPQERVYTGKIGVGLLVYVRGEFSCAERGIVGDYLAFPQEILAVPEGAGSAAGPYKGQRSEVCQNFPFHLCKNNTFYVYLYTISH